MALATVVVVVGTRSADTNLNAIELGLARASPRARLLPAFNAPARPDGDLRLLLEAKADTGEARGVRSLDTLAHQKQSEVLARVAVKDHKAT